MTILRISQQPINTPDRYRIEMSVEVPGQMRLATGTELYFALNPEVRQHIRWYLQDYLDNAHNASFVDSTRLGAVLAESRCQSATADAVDNPEAVQVAGADARANFAIYG